jgi:hypothetical protein
MKSSASQKRQRARRRFEDTARDEAPAAAGHVLQH